MARRRSPVDITAKVAFLESPELPEAFAGSRAFVSMDSRINACARERRGRTQRRQAQGELFGFDFKVRARTHRCLCRSGDHLIEDGFHGFLGYIGLVGAFKNEILDASACCNSFEAQGHSVSENGDGECVDVLGGGSEAPL